jgi:hypothetical protein
MRKIICHSLFIADFIKTAIIIPGLIGFFFIFLFVSCNRETEKNAVGFNSIQTNDTAYLFNDIHQPGCNLRIHFNYPDSAHTQLLPVVQSIFIEKTFGSSFLNLTPEKVVEIYTQQYIRNFKRFEAPEEFDETFNPAGNEGSNNQRKAITGFYYYTHLTTQAVYNRHDFISFTVQNTIYEGGAHSSQSLYGYVIDLKNKCLLKEEDFTEINYAQNIAPVLARKIAAANGLENPAALENIGYFSVEDIVPNNNFTIDDEGITYYFNEGEIAAAIMGVIKVFISYKEMDAYLKTGNPMSLLIN